VANPELDCPRVSLLKGYGTVSLPILAIVKRYHLLTLPGDCDPRIPAVCGVVRKNGVNKGRRFYNCADQACSSFFWDDERETMEQAQSGATQGENSVEQANNREPIPWRRYGMVWLCVGLWL
jgi:hypothetical protein